MFFIKSSRRCFAIALNRSCQILLTRAFVKDRAIKDNALIAFEAIHSMKRKNRGRYGEFALKIDISKAYDRVD